LRVRVVTQPGFVHRHGDRYRRSVEPADQPWLYRLRGWLDAGVSLGAGSDAPYGPEDPWTAIRAAVNRRTSEGYSLGPAEAVSPEAALAMFTSPLHTPGTPAGPLAVGDPADLCLLALPWQQARAELTADLVRCTLVGGRIVLPPPQARG
jgi:predicted amidohydrolase YtcJ